MSGHSKWANIKNRKSAQDKKKSTAFTRAAKDILTAIREGGGNINQDTNSYLKTAIDRSREVNMPKENVARLLERFEARKNNLVTMRLEGYGPFGVPVIIEAETDNKNRTIAEIKSILKTYDGSLGENGSVAFQFSRWGKVELKNAPREEEMMDLIDEGVEDIEGNVLWAKEGEVKKVASRAREMGLEVVRSTEVMRPMVPMKLEDGQEEKVLDLLEALEENEDVINVFDGLGNAI